MKVNMSIVLFVIYLIGLIAIIVFSVLALGNETTSTDNRFNEDIDDSNIECVNYLNSIKSESLTYPYALLNAGVLTLVFLFLFVLLFWSGCIEFHPGILFAIILVIFICIWCFTYKVFGCFLARSICGGACRKNNKE